MDNTNDMMQRSITFGSFLGIAAGALIGAAAGAITATWNGVFIGIGSGAVLGLITGILTAIATVKAAGTTGGVSTGAYTGMGLGAVIGGIFGAMIPDSVRMSANTQHTPVLDALTQGRFETAVLICFLLSVLGTAVGAWIGGRNLVPRKKE